MKTKARQIPDREGIWKSDDDGEEIEVYHLEPAGGQLCVWGPDVGCSYSGAAETQAIWDTDEFQGHILVDWHCSSGNWSRVGGL